MSALGRFGVGKNMVASIHHWAVAIRLIDDSSDPRLLYKISGITAKSSVNYSTLPLFIYYQIGLRMLKTINGEVGNINLI